MHMVRAKQATSKTRVLLFVLFLTASCGAIAQHQIAENYHGKWKAVAGSQDAKINAQIILRKDSIEISLDTLTRVSAYTLTCAPDSCLLTIFQGKSRIAQCVITPIDQNAFYFNTLENHERHLGAKQVSPGTIGWGWSDPRPIRFERQQDTP